MLSYKERKRLLENTHEYKAQGHKNDFAIFLNKILKRKRISKSAFAEMIDSSKPYVTKLLRGEENLSINTMTKITHVLKADFKMDVVEAEKNRIIAESSFGFATVISEPKEMLIYKIDNKESFVVAEH